MTTMSIEQRKNIRDELNEAIWKVITTQFKKDAKAAHEMVSAFGYDIYKTDGHYHVLSKATQKSVFIHWESYRKYDISLGNNWKEQPKDKPCRVDFVGVLETPVNETYINLRYARRSYESPAIVKYRRLRRLKYDTEYYGKQIEELKEKISNIQDSIVFNARMQKAREDELWNYKQELGLV